MDKVLPQAKEQARWTAFTRKAKEVKDSIKLAMDAGKTFESAVVKLGFNVCTTESFSVFSANTATNKLNYPESLPAGVMSLQKGDLGGPIRADEGALLAWVADRAQSEAGSAQFIRSYWESSLDRELAGFTFEDWKEYALAHAGLQDFRPISTDTNLEQRAAHIPSPPPPQEIPDDF